MSVILLCFASRLRTAHLDRLATYCGIQTTTRRVCPPFESALVLLPPTRSTFSIPNYSTNSGFCAISTAPSSAFGQHSVFTGVPTLDSCEPQTHLALPVSSPQPFGFFYQGVFSLLLCHVVTLNFRCWRVTFHQMHASTVIPVLS